MTYTTEYTRNARTLLKLSTPVMSTPQSSFRRFKSSFKSASSPQQLNSQMDEAGDSSLMERRENGQLPMIEAVSSGPLASQLELPVHSLTSLSLPSTTASVTTTGRHLSKLGSRNRHALRTSSSHQALHCTEANVKERKWRSVWSMASLTEGYVSGEERSAGKKHSGNNSTISSFYRNAANGTGTSKLSYNRREVKKASACQVYFTNSQTY